MIMAALLSFLFGAILTLLASMMAIPARTADVDALLAIKAELDDPDGNLRNWQLPVDASQSPPPWCAWRGIRCNTTSASGDVVGLDLSNLNLSGSVSPAIQGLASLASLNVSGNRLGGQLPVALTSLTRLRYLDISRNTFNGSLPAGFFRLKALVHFTAYSNSFSGPLPIEFVHVPALQHFDLGGSYFAGPIPPEYGALASVRYLDLSGNLLNGTIPSQLGNLPCVRFLKLGWNAFSGGIPPELGNLSTLEYLDLAGGHLSGRLPPELGKLWRLHTLFLYQNRLSGSIPAEIGNLTGLMSLDLSQNELSGRIPESFTGLRRLTLLSLMYNGLGGEIPGGIGELPELATFLIWNNSLTGRIPEGLGRRAGLEWFDASANRLEGAIPAGICDRGRLYKLMLFSNRLTGRIPASLGRCGALVRLRLEGNLLAGPIPAGLGTLPNFTYLDVSSNRLTGPLPMDLFSSPNLQFLGLSRNPIAGPLPPSLWRMPSLQKLYASSCLLRGPLPPPPSCPPLIALDLSRNLINGSLPRSLALCQQLILLNLSSNRLRGPIPRLLATLRVLSTLDLSHNHLSGRIPLAFENATALEVLDVSYNNLSGILPSAGLFRIISPSMLAGNQNLCGGVLGACDAPWSAADKRIGEASSPSSGKKINIAPMAWVVGAIFAMTLVVLVAAFRFFYKHFRWHFCRFCRCGQGDDGAWKLTAFQRLSFTTDDILKCLSTDNIIGMGAAGTVYRADMPNGEVVAVKKLWNSQKEGETKGQHTNILAEVDVLGSVRHRNIVRLLGCCCSVDTTLLIYEYMPNGSLGDLLHGNKKANTLTDWMTRYKIAMGVAQGLCYLHHDCFPVVIHRDVKSNNILLDANMEARVADFGVAKLIESSESMSVVAGSYGYIAPEYAYTMQVDEKSDIYSFGVVLLELLTGKRPVEPEFGDQAATIVEWVRGKIRPLESAGEERESHPEEDEDEVEEGVREVLDARMGEASLRWVREEMMLVLRVALLCTSKAPTDRPSMRDVVTMLSEAKPRHKSFHDQA